MLPMKAVRLKLGDLLAANVATLAPVVANKIALVIAPFTKNELQLYADLTYATFTGGDPKSGAAGAQQVGVMPSTSEQVITILAPVGGWRWECTATPTPAQQIYGYALVNDAEDTLLGLEILPVPVTISQATDFIDLGSIAMTFLLQPLS